MENKLTHFDNSGNARMVDVSEKKGTVRVATAVSKIKMSKETLELIKQGKIGKQTNSKFDSNVSPINDYKL